MSEATFSIHKGNSGGWDDTGSYQTQINIHLAIDGFPTREDVEAKLEDLIGQVLDAY